MIGPPGVAKTELVNAIGSALREDSKRLHKDKPENWFSYQVYDASKMNFEDMFGYPNVAALQANPPRVDFIPTPSSIWNKDMIAFDELNRCQEDRQSNLFELIRSRKLQGCPTNNKFIFSTMNPFGDQGTVEMSSALVDRHTFYLKIDNFDAMASSDRQRVISRVGNFDGVGFSYWGGDESKFVTTDDTVNEELANIGAEIRKTLVNASDYYKKLKESSEAAVVTMIDKLVGSFQAKFRKEKESIQQECKISGRRAASLMRGILSTRAVQIALKKENEKLPDMMATLINTTKLCLPIGIAGTLDQNVVDQANALVDTTVKELWPDIQSNRSTSDVDMISDAMSTDNPLKILNTLLSVDCKPVTRSSLASRFLDKDKYLDDDGNHDEHMHTSVKALLFKLNKEIPGFLPDHLDLDITPTDIERVSKSKQLKGKSSYLDIIQNRIDHYSSDPILSFALKISMTYYFKTTTEDDQAIRAVIDTDELCESIESAITTHKENAKIKTTDTGKTAATEVF